MSVTHRISRFNVARRYAMYGAAMIGSISFLSAFIAALSGQVAWWYAPAAFFAGGSLGAIGGAAFGALEPLAQRGAVGRYLRWILATAAYLLILLPVFVLTSDTSIAVPILAWVGTVIVFGTGLAWITNR